MIMVIYCKSCTFLIIEAMSPYLRMKLLSKKQLILALHVSDVHSTEISAILITKGIRLIELISLLGRL